MKISNVFLKESTVGEESMWKGNEFHKAGPRQLILRLYNSECGFGRDILLLVADLV